MSNSDLDINVPKDLLGEFPPHTYAMWKQAAVDLLKGAPFEKRLITPTYEGFELQPIYNASDLEGLPHLRDTTPGSGTQVRGATAAGYRQKGWGISQELSAPTPEALNAILLHELQKGQNELNLWFDAPSRAGLDPDDAKASGVGQCGVSIATVADFDALLADVQLPAISTYLRAGAAPEALAALWFAAVERSGTDLASLTGCIEADPLAYLVEHGRYPTTLGKAFDGMAALHAYAMEKAPQLQTIAVQGHPYHNGGASSVQEMAAVLATGVTYLRALLERGAQIEDLVPRIRLSLSVGSQYFIEIAKFRAMRILWNRILESFGAPTGQRGVHLHARTGLWNKTQRDPYVNSLRTTTEAFAAVVAGVDSLHIGAFDEIIREPDEFSRRIARNTHHVLGEECDLMRVVDPAGGSWAIESLTDQMATKAWEAFQKIEADGGIVAALEAGRWQSEIGATLERKQQALGQRRDVLVGTNNYPNVGEKPLAPRAVDYAAVARKRTAALAAARRERDAATVEKTLAREPGLAPLVAAAKAGATLGELAAALREGSTPTTLSPVRLERGAAPFEALAERVGRLGEAATLLQLNFGPSRRYRMRADWTSAFFRVAGFPVAADDDFLTLEDAVAAAQASPGQIVLIVSDDPTYAEVVPDLARALKAARPELHLVLAGAPGDTEAAWREAGIDDFVHVRVNNFAFNEALATRLEG